MTVRYIKQFIELKFGVENQPRLAHGSCPYSGFVGLNERMTSRLSAVEKENGISL